MTDKPSRDPLEVRVAEVMARAVESLAEDDLFEAFSSVKALLPDEKLSRTEPHYKALMGIIEKIMKHIDQPALAISVTGACEAPDDFALLCQTGQDLIDAQLYAFATLPIYRAKTVNSTNFNIMVLLAHALDGMCLHQEVVDLLRTELDRVRQTFNALYLLAYNLIMTGRIDDALAEISQLKGLATGDQLFDTARLNAMHARAELIRDLTPLDHQDLAGWHFVKMGGILTHVAADGFDEGMNGRHGYFGDSYGFVRYGIEQLRTILKTWSLKPRQIIHPQDRDSTILAHAVARLMELPRTELSSHNGPGLIVCYDQDAMTWEELESIESHQGDSPFFCHAVNWVSPPPLSPDIVTFLHESVSSPWGETMKLMDGNLEIMPEDDRPVEEIAEDILRAEANSGQENRLGPELIPFLERTKSLATFFHRDGYRGPYLAGGPVKSSSFA